MKTGYRIGPARQIATGLASALLALGIFAGSLAAQAGGPEDSVRNLYDTLLVTMKDGRVLGGSARYAKIEPVVRRLFDISSMARLAVGPSWANLSPTQRQQVTAAFAGYISATYADRFDSYAGQRLEVIGQQGSDAGVIVKTHIVKANGEAVAIDYSMRQSDGSWRIADVYLDGTISQLATQRSEFGAIIRREGFDGLLAALNRKVNLLTTNVARAS